MMPRKPPLPCLNCCDEYCRIDPKRPPCQGIDPLAIAEAANNKLRSVTTEDISAVVVIYKPQVEKLNQCLEALLPQVSEIVVVGDMDTPTPLVGALNDRKIRFLFMQATDTGYGRKATYGARHSNGRYIWFCNDDLYPNQDVAAQLMKLLEPEDVGVATHLLRYPGIGGTRGLIQYAGVGRPPGHVGFGHIDLKKMESRYKAPVEQEGCCGASMIVKRKAFFQVDGFCEQYRLYSEDADFSMKIRKAGWKIMFTPLATGIHDEHQSAKLRPDIDAIRRESAELFARKWRDYFRRNPDVNKLGTFK